MPEPKFDATLLSDPDALAHLFVDLRGLVDDLQSESIMPESRRVSAEDTDYWCAGEVLKDILQRYGAWEYA